MSNLLENEFQIMDPNDPKDDREKLILELASNLKEVTTVFANINDSKLKEIGSIAVFSGAALAYTFDVIVHLRKIIDEDDIADGFVSDIKNMMEYYFKMLEKK